MRTGLNLMRRVARFQQQRSVINLKSCTLLQKSWQSQFNAHLSYSTASSIRIIVELERSTKKKMDPSRFLINSAVLRYEPNGDRFLFSFKLSSGKVFNFDRATTETFEVFNERIVANMKKKYRDAEVKVNFILPNGYNLNEPVKPLMEFLVSEMPEFVFQINENSSKVVDINPPEIFSIKLHEQAFVGFPLHPNKIESTSNFVPEASRFLWEMTRDEGKTEAAKSKNGPRKVIRSHWNPCGSGRVYFPGDDLLGSYLRLVCTPSDGQKFGEACIAEMTTSVSALPVERLLYEERLARLKPISPTDAGILRVMTYNILADTYTTPEWFNHSPVESLDYSYRLPLLEKEIMSYNADIICLQEVDEKSYMWDLEPFLRETKQFRGSFSCKTGNTREGVASFYNPEKLEIVDVETVMITEAMKSTSWWSQLETLEELRTRLEERNTVFQICTLRNRLQNEESLVVLGVTHLYFHPTADHIRLLQTMVCAQRLEKKVAELKNKFPSAKIRVLFAGDFNCTPPYSSHRLLNSGNVTADDPDWISCEGQEISPGINFSHQLNLSSTHSGEYLTNITMNFEGCIDYIFYQRESFELVNEYPPPDKTTISQIVGCQDARVSLPNLFAPSDHLPVIVDLKLI